MSEETALATTSPATPVVASTVGVGIDSSSKLFKLKPATLVINQKQTQADDATPGLFRVVETGQEYEEMRVALLFTPTESRACYTGQKGQMNRTKDNLICFSTDMIKPHPKSKDMQAPNCAGCPQQDWAPWRAYKDKTGESNQELIPSCEVMWKAFLVDQKFKIPMKMYLRNENAKNFVAAMNKMSWTFETIRNLEEREPSIFEVSFVMRTKGEKNKKGITIYSLDIPAKSFEIISKEDFTKFGAVYTKLVASFAQEDSEKTAGLTNIQGTVNKDIDAAISGEVGITGDDETVEI
jgi:hypothetical protein